MGGKSDGLAAPRLLQVSETGVIGQGCGGCTIEVFSDPGSEADSFEGRVRSDQATGLFVFEKAARAFRHGNVAVTGTDLNGNTSSLSDSWPLPGRPTPTRAAPTAVTTPTRPPNLNWSLFLPRSERPTVYGDR